MSSPDISAAGSNRKRKPPARPKSNSAPRKPATESSISTDATHLAGRIEHALKHDELDALSADAMQALMAAISKFYSAQVEAGRDVLPLKPGSRVTPTDVMTVASGLLRSVNLAVFELGMWQSWTGR